MPEIQKVLNMIHRKKISWETMKRRDWKADYRTGYNTALEELEKEIVENNKKI